MQRCINAVIARLGKHANLYKFKNVEKLPSLFKFQNIKDLLISWKHQIGRKSPILIGDKKTQLEAGAQNMFSYHLQFLHSAMLAHVSNQKSFSVVAEASFTVEFAPYCLKNTCYAEMVCTSHSESLLGVAIALERRFHLPHSRSRFSSCRLLVVFR